MVELLLITTLQGAFFYARDDLLASKTMQKIIRNKPPNRCSGIRYIFRFNANLNGTELFGDVRTLIVHCKPNRFVI